MAAMDDGNEVPAQGRTPPGGRQARTRRGPRRATARYLENAALYYLQRFASSSANLRRVLMRKVDRSARFHGTDPGEGAALVDALIARFEKSGLLDDRTYAEARVRSLRRRGDSARLIRAKLAAKGLDGETIEAALAACAEEDAGDPELAAAAALARRRRLGPYRNARARKTMREKDLAALARAGFSYDVARRVVEAESAEDLAAAVTDAAP